MNDRPEALVVELTADDEWPEAVSDGLTLACSDCGLVPAFDYTVTDDFWLQWVTGSAQRSVVCLPCLDIRCSGIGLVAALIQVHWTGTGHTVVLHPERRYLYPVDR